jgi:phospholipase/carboxylesterase
MSKWILPGSGSAPKGFMKANRVDIAGVECLEVIGNDSDVGIVFFHGYGANMHDLFPLWEMWHKDKFNWYFPNGVQSLPMGYYEGRAWFSIDVMELERSIREGRARDMKSRIPPELDETLSVLERVVLELSKKHKTLILGGFSQGAMCASHLAMKESLKIDGLVLLSGALLAEERFPKTAKAIPFYQSHGSKDPILSIEGAKDLEQKLQSLNFKGKLQTFNGGHEIPASVIHEVRNFLHQFA